MRTGLGVFDGGGGEIEKENEIEEFERKTMVLIGLLCEDVTLSFEKFVTELAASGIDEPPYDCCQNEWRRFARANEQSDM